MEEIAAMFSLKTPVSEFYIRLLLRDSAQNAQPNLAK